MFSRTFIYTGYDGKEHKDTWWFNLSEAELYKLELTNLGGMNGMMNKLLRESKPGEIVDLFENLILSAVGERSIDGRKFIKNEEIRDDFKQSKAYSDLFVELVKSGEKLAEFLRGAIPEEVAKKLAEAEAEENTQAERPALAALPNGKEASGKEVTGDAVH
jgi:hypothetical protein